VVWINTKELGVGKANTSSGAIILVYRYSPSGNYLGAFAKNVLPPPGNAFTHTASILVCLILGISSMALVIL
jgi:hypothetical protein